MPYKNKIAFWAYILFFLVFLSCGNSTTTVIANETISVDWQATDSVEFAFVQSDIINKLNGQVVKTDTFQKNNLPTSIDYPDSLYQFVIKLSFLNTQGKLVWLQVLEGDFEQFRTLIQTLSRPVITATSEGAFEDSVGIVFQYDTAFSQVHYSLGGNPPDPNNNLFNNGDTLWLKDTTQIKAQAFPKNTRIHSISDIETRLFVKSSHKTLDPPTIAPVILGDFSDSIQVVISDFDSSISQVRYTTDNSEPNDSSTKYTGQLVFYQTTTIKAAVFPFNKDKFLSSNIVTFKAIEAGVVILNRPQIKPSIVSDFIDSVGIIIFDFDSSISQVRYTLEGSVPTSTSLLYQDTLYVKQNTTVKAVAFPVNNNYSQSQQSDLTVVKYIPPKLALPYVYQDFSQLDSVKVVTVYDTLIAKLNWGTLQSGLHSTAQTIENGLTVINWSFPKNTQLYYQLLPRNVKEFSASDTAYFSIAKFKAQKPKFESNNFYRTAILCKNYEDFGVIKYSKDSTNLLDNNIASASNCIDSVMTLSDSGVYYYRLLFENQHSLKADSIYNISIQNVTRKFFLSLRDSTAYTDDNGVYHFYFDGSNKVFFDYPEGFDNDSVEIRYIDNDQNVQIYDYFNGLSYPLNRDFLLVYSYTVNLADSGFWSGIIIGNGMNANHSTLSGVDTLRLKQIKLNLKILPIIDAYEENWPNATLTKEVTYQVLPNAISSTHFVYELIYGENWVYDSLQYTDSTGTLFLHCNTNIWSFELCDPFVFSLEDVFGLYNTAFIID